MHHSQFTIHNSQFTIHSSQPSTSLHNARPKVLAESLNSAIGDLLVQGKNPGRKVGQLDNRGSHFYVAKFWAEQLAAQTKDSDLAAEFAPIAANLNANEETILTGPLNIR